jgi:hypothetical protein
MALRAARLWADNWVLGDLAGHKETLMKRKLIAVVGVLVLVTGRTADVESAVLYFSATVAPCVAATPRSIR